MTTETNLKTAPNSKESEMMVLGCMLTSLNALNIAADSLDDIDFYYTEHKIIFQVLKNAYKNDSPADVHLICEELKRLNKLQAIGGPGYIATLAQYAGTSANIEEYVKQVHDKALLRRLIHTSQIIEKKALDEPHDVYNLVEEVQEIFKEIVKIKGYLGKEVSQVGEIIQGVKSQIDQRPFFEKIKERHDFYKTNGKPFLTGIPTGFKDLDNQAIVLEDTNLIIVAARPAMGKTALALNIASYTCFEKNMPVGVISLEMGRDQLLERLISSQTRITGEKIKRGILTDNELKKISEESERISDSPFFIIDRGCHTIERVASIARVLKDSKDIKLLVLDYLQLLGTGGSSDSRQYEVAEISRCLKILAMELKIPVLCVAQLSRKVEERTDKRPLLSDLRDSGQIEQDADAVLFIYRRDYYDKTEKQGQADLLLRKNRHGPEADAKLYFNKDCGKFSDLDLSGQVCKTPGEF